MILHWINLIKILWAMKKSSNDMEYVFNAKKASPENKNIRLNKIKRLWAKYFVNTMKLNITYYYQEPLENVPALYIINHRSMVDIPIIENAFQNFNGYSNWIAKSSLFKWKILGNFFKYSKTLSVDREDVNSLRSLKRQVEKRLNETEYENIIMFPEGTRNKTDDILIEFKPGAEFLSRSLKLDVIPVFIKTDTRKVMSGKIKNIEVYFGERIHPKKGKMRKEYFSFINKCLHKKYREELVVSDYYFS